jgi:hypothetical protein
VFKNASSLENRFLSVAHELVLDTGARKSIIYTSYRTPHKHLVNIPKYRELTEDTCSVFRVREQALSTRKRVRKPLAQRRVANRPYLSEITQLGGRIAPAHEYSDRL